MAAPFLIDALGLTESHRKMVGISGGQQGRSEPASIQ
jgi:hypothetical protein